MEAPEATVPALASESPAAATLVWIDADKATIVRWSDGQSDITHLESDVPSHRRATGRKRRQTRHESAVRIGGSGQGVMSGGFGHPNPDDGSHRLEHLRRFVAEVTGQLDGDERLLIVGAGTVREQLDRSIREQDEHHRRTRVIACEPSTLLTERQMVARLRDWVGDPPRRRTTGAYRWTGELATRHSGATAGIPGRITEKPPRTRELLEEALEADPAAEVAPAALPNGGIGGMATSQLASDIGESAGSPDEEPAAEPEDEPPA